MVPGHLLEYCFLSLFIPGWVETDQLTKIALLVAKVNPEIAFTLLAFFPEFRMLNTRPPNTGEMIESYHAVKNAGFRNVRTGNIGGIYKNRQRPGNPAKGNGDNLNHYIWNS
jgi:pyruvate formate lyase activating enzyme